MTGFEINGRRVESMSAPDTPSGADRKAFAEVADRGLTTAGAGGSEGSEGSGGSGGR